MALFRLRAECGAVLKIDSGDMLVLSDLTPLLRWAPGKDVWAAQALGQPTGNLNGGLVLFGRYWLHAATERAMAARATMESREQSLFNGFFRGHLRMLPKRYNAEHRMWDTAHAAWLQEQNETVGPDAAPPLERAAVLHFVGRDKPWMLLDTITGAHSRPELAACSRKAREKEEKAAMEATCQTQRTLQALWWREFGAGCTVVVGDSARRMGQGFVVEQFETVLRMHDAGLEAADAGKQTGGTKRCADAAGCRRLARGPLYTVGNEPELPEARSLLHSVYRRKVGVFGGLV